MELTIQSAAFAHGLPIPRLYSGQGKDVSPPLNWSGVPEATQELALIVDDPDAPSPEPWVHWVIYKIPPDTAGLAEGIPTDAELSSPAGALQGPNTSGDIGYHGPMPPQGHGVHHYHFKLYALDAHLDLKSPTDKQALLAAMQGHVLAEAELIGTYQR